VIGNHVAQSAGGLIGTRRAVSTPTVQRCNLYAVDAVRFTKGSRMAFANGRPMRFCTVSLPKVVIDR